MKVSVFTPLTENGNQYIRETYESLLAQTFEDWEWVVLENHGGKLPKNIATDGRVRVFQSERRGVGALKREACGHCTGDVLVELDHDDLLDSQALDGVADAVSRGADFVYSDFAAFVDGTWEAHQFTTVEGQPAHKYNPNWGWGRYHIGAHGRSLVAQGAPRDPRAWRRIEWAPNHLRAWRREFYETIGGHDPSLEFADDHDLVLRSYLQGGKCVHVPGCLYLYRVHPTQNVNTRNARIQELEAGVYAKYVYRLFEKIADDEGLAKIDLCGAHGCPERYTPIDRYPAPGRPRRLSAEAYPDIDVRGKYQDSSACIVADLERRWPIAESQVGVIRAFDALEHLWDKVHTMNEAHRVLAPGGVMLIRVPSTDAMLINGKLINGSGAYCDPTHVSFWNEMSFRYYCDENFRKYVPELLARFQVSRVVTVNSGGIPYVVAELIALKDGYSPMGDVRC